ncbi:MAG TPA: hypothetical protein VGN16_07795 [Acidobacteriaceae bacterium]
MISSKPRFAPGTDELESRIAHQALLLHASPTPLERHSAWEELKRLHALRSPEQITEMEIEQGLAR